MNKENAIKEFFKKEAQEEARLRALDDAENPFNKVFAGCSTAEEVGSLRRKLRKEIRGKENAADLMDAMILASARREKEVEE